MFRDIKVKSWKHLRDSIDEFNSSKSSHNSKWLFRGQSNHKWKLSTTLERARLTFDEKKIIRDFKKNAHLYINTDKIHSSIDWLSIMQHYGCPTRLLDWTKSPYVAIFFALNNVSIEEDFSAVYALNTSPILIRINGKYQMHKKYSFLSESSYLENYELSEEDFQYIFDTDWVSMENYFGNYVLPVMPFFGHTRLTIQQGVFLLPTNANGSFESNIKEVINEQPKDVREHFFRRYLIPSKLKPEIIYELNSMNINDATLFPGIEGYSKFLEKKYSLFDENYLVKEKKKKNSAPNKG